MMGLVNPTSPRRFGLAFFLKLFVKYPSMRYTLHSPKRTSIPPPVPTHFFFLKKRLITFATYLGLFSSIYIPHPPPNVTLGIPIRKIEPVLSKKSGFSRLFVMACAPPSSPHVGNGVLLSLLNIIFNLVPFFFAQESKCQKGSKLWWVSPSYMQWFEHAPFWVGGS